MDSSRILARVSISLRNSRSILPALKEFWVAHPSTLKGGIHERLCLGFLRGNTHSHLRFGRIVIENSRSQLLDEKFLNQIGPGGCASSDRPAFECQRYAIAIFRRIVEI
jgi:hypothetical protein